MLYPHLNKLKTPLIICPRRYISSQFKHYNYTRNFTPQQNIIHCFGVMIDRFTNVCGNQWLLWTELWCWHSLNTSYVPLIWYMKIIGLFFVWFGGFLWVMYVIINQRISQGSNHQHTCLCWIIVHVCLVIKWWIKVLFVYFKIYLKNYI